MKRFLPENGYVRKKMITFRYKEVFRKKTKEINIIVKQLKFKKNVP